MEQEKQFSDSDRAALDEIIRQRDNLLQQVEDRKRRQWLIDLLKRWATWLTAIILASGAIWDLLARIAKALSESHK